jgi:hypothetical protein
MFTIHVNQTAAQSPSVADFEDAIRDARFALHNGPLHCATNHLEKASRIADEVGNPHARQLASFGSEVRSAFETVQVSRCVFSTCSPSSEPLPPVADRVRPAASIQILKSVELKQ